MPNIDPAIAAHLLGLPAPCKRRPNCKAGRKLLIRTPGKYLWVSASCKLWKCKACLPVLRLKWGEQAMKTIYTSALSLYHAAIEEGKWNTIRRTLIKPRKGKPAGLYFRVRETVISTAPIAFDKSPPIRNDEAIRLIGAALAGISSPQHQRGRFRPVTTSRVWAIGKPPKGEGVLVAAMSGSISMETILQEMRHHNVEAESCGFGTSITFPPETDDARIGVILECLRKRKPFVRVDPPDNYEPWKPPDNIDDLF